MLQYKLNKKLSYVGRSIDFWGCSYNSLPLAMAENSF